MESDRIRKLVILVVIVAAFYGLSMLMKPKLVTNSPDPRFNNWVAYFQRQEGYTVEYHDFDTFEDMVDEMYKPVGSPNPQPILSHVFASAVKVHSLGPEFEGTEMEAIGTRASLDYPVTVYYDDEDNIIFFVGNAASSRFFYAARATDLTATYGYYTAFQAN